MKDSRTESPLLVSRRAAMNMLARREHSFAELLDKLATKFPDFNLDTDIIPAVERLRGQNLQSDSRFVEAFVRYKSNRGAGPLKISAELYPRKIDDSLMRQALYAEGLDWAALCAQALEKKFKPLKAPDMKEKLRWSRFLQQRGFEHEQIRNAIKCISELVEDRD